MSLSARDVMTTEVITVTPATPLSEFARPTVLLPWLKFEPRAAAPPRSRRPSASTAHSSLFSVVSLA